MDELQAVMPKDNDLLLLGSEPPVPTACGRRDEEGPHLKVVRVDVPTGKTAALDLTAESLKQSE